MENKIVELLTSIQNAVTTMAPEAWQALVFTARVNSILTLAFCAFAGTLVYATLKVWPPVWEYAQQRYIEPLAVIGAVVVGVVVVIALVCLFSTSTWLGLFYPESVVVTDLVSKVK